MQQVLVIDDHLQVREMTSRLLAGRYEVTLREDALTIVSDYESLGGPVVVLDVSMPQLDGFSAARMLKREHPEARIVFFSSDPSPQKVAEASKVGGCAYVVKARAMMDLIPAIQAAIEHSGGTART